MTKPDQYELRQVTSTPEINNILAGPGLNIIPGMIVNFALGEATEVRTARVVEQDNPAILRAVDINTGENYSLSLIYMFAVVNNHLQRIIPDQLDFHANLPLGVISHTEKRSPRTTRRPKKQ